MEKIKIVVDACERVNLDEISIYDMRNNNPFYDYLVIASGNSDRQLSAVISYIQDDLKEHNFEPANIEGKTSKTWVLVDTKDIVLNVFTKDERHHYNLETMLVDVPKLSVEDFK